MKLLILSVLTSVVVATTANAESFEETYPQWSERVSEPQCDGVTLVELESGKSYSFFNTLTNNTTENIHVNYRTIRFFDAQGNQFETDPGNREIVDPGSPFDWTDDLREISYTVEPGVTVRTYETGETLWKITGTPSDEEYDFTVVYGTVFDEANTENVTDDDLLYVSCQQVKLI